MLVDCSSCGKCIVAIRFVSDSLSLCPSNRLEFTTFSKIYDAVKELNNIDGFEIVMLKNKYQNPTPVRIMGKDLLFTFPFSFFCLLSLSNLCIPLTLRIMPNCTCNTARLQRHQHPAQHHAA